MKTQIARGVSLAALAAAVAVIFLMAPPPARASTKEGWAPRAVARAPAYEGSYPSILSSFRMSGVTVPYARGIFAWSINAPDVYGIFYQSTNYNYLYKFQTSGSLVSTVRLPGAVKLGDADHPPEGYGGCFAVVDEGAHELKAYTFTGSFYGVIRTLPSDVVAYGRGGYTKGYLYLATNNGVVFCYTPTWSLANSYPTGVAVADLAAGYGYGHYWGDYLEVGSRQAGDPIRVYYGPAGVMAASFALPGIRSCGAVGGGQSYWCLRDLGTEIWAYRVAIAGLMEVQTASLGKVKALYK